MGIAKGVIFLIFSVELLCQTDRKFRTVQVYPTNIELLLSGTRMDQRSPLLNRSLTCSRRGDNTNLAFRVLIVKIPDIREVGLNSFQPMYCLDQNMTWLKNTDCGFVMNITINSLRNIEPLYSIFVQCIYKLQVYTTEVLTKEYDFARIINYPKRKTQIQLYHPMAVIICSASNDDKVHWMDLRSGRKYENVYVAEVAANRSGCQPIAKSEFNLLCRTTSSILITFRVQDCFEINFRVLDSGIRATSVYDAGDVVTCDLTPKIDKTEYFSTSLLPVVTLFHNAKPMGAPQVFFEIPQNLKVCSNCYLICGFQYLNSTYLLTEKKKNIKILTNHKTHVEVNEVQYAHKVLHVFLKDYFRCSPRRYDQPTYSVVSTTNLSHSLLSNIHSGEGIIRHYVNYNQWTRVNTYLYIQQPNMYWYIHCVLKNGEVSSPMRISVLDPVKIEVTLVNPLPESQNYTLEGFVYQCKSLSLAFVRLVCIDECASVSVNSSFPQKVSFAVITAVFYPQQIFLRCLGFRFIGDRNPILKNKVLHAIPSQLHRPGRDIPVNATLSCARHYKINKDNTVVKVNFDFKLIFTLNGVTQTISTDIRRNISSIVIPETIQLGSLVKSCCVDSVNEMGLPDCSEFSTRVVNVIKIVRTIYSPSLAKNGSSLVEVGSTLSCKICFVNFFHNSSLRCLSNTMLKLSIFKPDSPAETRQGFFSVTLPTLREMGAQNSIRSWNFTLSCESEHLYHSHRIFKLQFCEELRLIPESKELFQINETIECVTTSKHCPLDQLFQILVYTNNVLTYRSEKGLGVNLDSRFVGINDVICSNTHQANRTTRRRIFVESAPVKIEIFNEKKIMMVGDVAICEGWGFPTPWKQWWFISGPEVLDTRENRLSILPNSQSSDYAYDCVVDNFHGNLTKRFAFSVYNKFRHRTKTHKYEAENIWFNIYLLLVLVLYVLLLGLCNFFIFGTRFRKSSPIA